MIGDQLLGIAVNFLADAKLSRASRRIIRRVRLALMLRDREQRGIPCIAAKPGGVGDGKAEIVADFRAGAAFGLVFVIAGRPFSRRVGLSRRGDAGEQQDRQKTSGTQSGQDTNYMQTAASAAYRNAAPVSRNST